MASLTYPLTKRSGLLAALILLGLLLTALGLMSDVAKNADDFGRAYTWLLAFSVTGLFILALFIIRNLYSLVRQFFAGAPGTRLTLRLVSAFVIIAFIPVAIVYFFSLHFLERGIDSWFDVRVEESLEDALELSRTALDFRMREVLKQTTRMANELSGMSSTQATFQLGKLLETIDTTELTLFSQNGRIIATANIDPLLVIPTPLPEVVLLQVRRDQSHVSLEPIDGHGFHIRAVVRIPTQNVRQSETILQALFPVAGRFSVLADSVQSAFDSYKELVFLRTPLKTSFILTLSLVMLFSVLTALWAAVYSARRLTEPVRDLAQGTQAVAAGHYDQQLPRSNNDELGFLVDSFNQMTRNLAHARDNAQKSQQLLESQRAYLEGVLARLSSGVLTLDHNGCLRTTNPAACQITGVNLHDLVGFDGAYIGRKHTHLLSLFDAIASHQTDTNRDWRQEITLFGNTGRQILMCRGSSLPDPVGFRGGYVIVFDDITTVVQAERAAAWAEVARRLAHEIKNPLTPIQLAAERIRHKYLKTLDESQSRVVDRGTTTIVQQVHAMKEMVDAFNDYARAPQLKLTALHLNDVITEVLYLYQEYPPVGVEIKLDLDPQQPIIQGDKGRLRQLLHNLVKNAIEAIVEGSGSMLRITTHCGNNNRETTHPYVELVFQDDGIGLPNEKIGDIFEPYVTTKPKGTGLGLAIVKKIVEEHSGSIRVEIPSEGGTRMIILFPPFPGALTSATKTTSMIFTHTEDSE
jgi:nitrogen fixation/metabolism regulation signal transduction histidine kinase